MLQWFIKFPEFTEFLIHLGKTPLFNHIFIRNGCLSNKEIISQVLEFLRPINAGVEKSGLLPENISKNRDIDSVPSKQFN